MTRAQTRAHRLADYRNRHAGETIVVCGCGTSLRQLTDPQRFLTIGVNDVGRLFDPTYLVVLNPKGQFKGDRFRYVETSRATAIFSQLDLKPGRGQKVVRFRLGRRGGTDVFSSSTTLPYTRNSPYVAVCLAAFLGAKRIALIGVDLTDDHFFARTGAHPLAGSLKSVDDEYRRLRSALRGRGVELVNLSAASRLTSLPKVKLGELDQKEMKRSPPSSSHRKLAMVSYATTPVAGVPSILARCIDHATAHQARCVWATRSYGNGVRFRGDVEWRSRPREARSLLAKADLVIVHNGKVDPAHRPLLAHKPTITMAHNYAWNVDRKFGGEGCGRVVVGQYQATLPELAEWTLVPNPIPLWEREFSPGSKPREITLCYTPSARHESYPESHRLFWHSKGYRTTMALLERLHRRWPIRLEVVDSRQISHSESLAMKRRSHIVIDECVTGSYHRNSLEGLAAGCVVVNGLGIRPAIAEVFRRCAPGSSVAPFVGVRLDSLEQRLDELIQLGEPELRARGAANREWLETHWRFEEQWQRSWEPEIERALAGRGAAATLSRARVERPKTGKAPRASTRAKTSRAIKKPSSSRPRAAPASRASAPATIAAAGVSVVVPHGDRERLPLLATTLRHLKTCSGIVDVIVVELDAAPYAERLARSLATAYVYGRHRGTFHKARAMNLGVPLTSCKRVLWLDSDVLIPERFLPRALDEMIRRRLDCLVPWTSVRYLSERDSRRVIDGSPLRRDWRPHQTYFSRHGVCGGAVLVRRAFVERYGGVPEEFRGWGGEDSAWMCKAQRLGRAAVTQRRNEHLHHLYHRLSGGHARGEHIRANPFYRRNFELLQEARATRSARQFLARFPPPRHQPLPWDRDRHLKIYSGQMTDMAAQICDQLRKRFDAKVTTTKGPPRASDRDRVDAAIFLGTRVAVKSLAVEKNHGLAARSVVVHDSDPAAARSLADFSRVAAHLAATSRVEEDLQRAGLSPWSGLRADHRAPSARRAVLKLLQPLSVVVGRLESSAEKGLRHAS